MFESIKSMEKIGQNQFSSFMRDCLILGKKPISETIHKNNFKIWDFNETDNEKSFAPTNSTINKMRSACEHRPELAENVFRYEILDVAHSLAKTSITAYHGKKSDITKRLSPFSFQYLPNSESNSAIILEMSPMIRAKCASIISDVCCFSDLAVVIFYQVQSLGSGYGRMDLVFDRYFEKSLKEDTRKNRGIGSRFVFTEDTILPNNMSEDFLMNSENKNEFNELLARKFHELHRGEQVLIVSYRDSVLYKPPSEPINFPGVSITECQSEEADQRLIRHALYCLASYQSYKRIVVRTIDTDVLILLISYLSFTDYDKSVDVYAEMINSSLFYDIGRTVEFLGSDICKAMSFFYTFTGCDIASSFYGKGKCKAWDTWMNITHKHIYTEVFTRLGNKPECISEEDLDILERFVIELYLLSVQQNTSPSSLASMRLENFKSSADNDLRKLPPSREALREHAKHASYQAGYLWMEALDNISLPDAGLWGWIFDEKKGIYVPRWQNETCPVDIAKFTTTCSCYKHKCKSCKCKGIGCISMCGCKRKCET